MKSTLAALAFFAFGLSGLRSGVVVYDLNFTNTLTTINYSFVQDGYMVIDPDAGTFGTVLVLRDPNSGDLYSSTSLLSGTFVVMIREDDDREFGVVNATGSGGDTSASLAFQMIGRMSGTRTLGGGVSENVPGTLRGLLIAYAPETSDEESFAYGFAGQSRVSAWVDEGFSFWSNFNGWSQSEALTNIQTVLQNNGTVPTPTPSPSPSPGPSPSPSPSPSPTASPSPSPAGT